MEKINFNSPTVAPKIGAAKGEKLPPGKYVLEFQAMRTKVSEDKKSQRAGHLLIVNEFNVARILSGGEPYANWDGNTLTAFPGARRSYTIDMSRDNALGQLNELALYLHGVNAKNPAALREIGVVAKDATAAEIKRAADEMNTVVNNCMSAENPLLNVRIECEVKASYNQDTKRTFMVHIVGLCTDPEDLAHNKAITG